MAKFTIWIDAPRSETVVAALGEGLEGHHTLWARDLTHPDAALEEADLAFGQPNVDILRDCQRLRWAQLSSAGYTSYDRDDLRAALKSRAAKLTNSSGVFNEPCAQHVLAMMLADARQLLPAYADQLNQHAWNTARNRAESYLLQDQTVLFLGFGAIGRRLAELLTPFHLNLVALRRQPRGDEPVEVIGEHQLEHALASADHVVNLLPASPSTSGYAGTEFFAAMKPGARYYNIGRGTTTDQDALLEALRVGQLELAYLDVTDPEPLPPGHPLWTAPNCYITPHTAGGHRGEWLRLAKHFLANFQRYQLGEELADRVI